MRTMRLASCQMIFAWSRLVATAYTSGPGSPSPIIRYRPTADASRDLPFFLPTINSASRYCRLPSMSTKPKIAASMAFSHSSKRTGWPPILPLE